MLLGTTILLSCLITAGSAGEEIAPIDESSQNRLQTVVDGLDSRGEGFAAMIDHVSAWMGTSENLQPPTHHFCWNLHNNSAATCLQFQEL